MPQWSLETLISGALSVILVAGCSTPQGASRDNVGRTGKKDGCPKVVVQVGPVDLDCFRFPGEMRTAYEQAAAGDVAARNRLAAMLIRRSDDACVQWMGRLTRQSSAANSLGLLKTAGEGMRGTADARGRHDRQLLRNLMDSAVASAVVAARDRKRDAMVKALDQAPAAYGVDRMIADAIDYDRLCSVQSGMQFILAAIERAGREGDDAARDE